MKSVLSQSSPLPAAKILNLTDVEIVKEHSALVKKIAYHLIARLPASIQVEDLIQSGMLGLLEAATNYDGDKGASFETYASIRIRGSMLDEVRKGDWTPRSVHRNSRMINEAINVVEGKLGREARVAEIAQYLGISLLEYHQMLQDLQGAKIFAFDDLSEKEQLDNTPSMLQASNPLLSLQQSDIKEKLAKLIITLPERERLVLALYYDEELNLKEIGEVIGVSESRVSQLLGKAAMRLQSRAELLFK